MFAWLDKQLHVHQKYFVDCVKPGEVTHLCRSIHQWRKKVFSAVAGLNHQVLAGCRDRVAGQIIRCWPVTEGCSHSKNVQDSRLTLPSFPKVKTTVSLMSLYDYSWPCYRTVWGFISQIVTFAHPSIFFSIFSQTLTLSQLFNVFFEQSRLAEVKW